MSSKTESEIKYQDIINMSYPFKNKNSKMTMKDRAAQFAPFSALTGYDEKLKEVERPVFEKIVLDENTKEIINEKLNMASNNKKVEITYFIHDKKKDGGTYEKIIDVIKNIDEVNQQIILRSGLIIKFDDIRDVNIN